MTRRDRPTSRPSSGLDRERGTPGRMAGWLAAGAAVLGATTLLIRHSHMSRVRALLGVRHDEESGRGRAATPASPAARRAGHETNDLAGGTLGKLLLLLGSVAFCIVFAMIGLRIWVTHTQVANEPTLTPVQTTVITPPDPHLQRDPLREFANLHAREERLLQGYAYVDGGRTHARIPIDQAMALTVGQPLAPPP